MRWVVVCAALVSFASCPTPSWAGNEATATELVAARELWEQAQDAQARHDWQGCEKALVAALPIVATPGIRFHLAHCREMQGKWVEALVEYKLIDEVIQSGTAAPDVEPLLKPAIARLESRTPKLTLELASTPETLKLVLDGKPVSPRLLNTRLSLNPGHHSVELEAPGYLPVSRKVTLVEAEDRRLPLMLVATSDGATSRQGTSGVGETYRSGDEQSIKPYLMIAEAALTLGAGSMALYYYLESKPIETGGVTQAQQSAETKAWVWGIGSGVGVASFFATWLLWEDSPIVVGATDSSARVLVHGVY